MAVEHQRAGVNARSSVISPAVKSIATLEPADSPRAMGSRLRSLPIDHASQRQVVGRSTDVVCGRCNASAGRRCHGSTERVRNGRVSTRNSRRPKGRAQASAPTRSSGSSKPCTNGNRCQVCDSPPLCSSYRTVLASRTYSRRRFAEGMNGEGRRCNAVKSGGPDMTVDKCWTDKVSGKEKVASVWMDSSGHHTRPQFHSAVVELAPKDASDDI